MAQWIVGSGAGFSWSVIYMGHWPADVTGWAVAIAILAAIAVEGIIAGLLAWALAFSSFKDPAKLN